MVEFCFRSFKLSAWVEFSLEKDWKSSLNSLGTKEERQAETVQL